MSYMQEDIREIYNAFGGRLIGTKQMKQYVCETVSLMPRATIDYITRRCWFMSSMKDAWAYTFIGNDLAGEHLIFLSDDLMSQSPWQIHYSIAHEIGHVMLGHKNSIGFHQTKDEIKKQEQEADDFARKFVN